MQHSAPLSCSDMALDAASSSSSVQHLPKKYDVFISFRGEDTRTNFTSHLYEALCRKQIKTYIDYELLKGDEISLALMRAIQDSYVSVVVFSENYASSRWCLDELTHILDCKRLQQQVVIPVFYKVEPSHVRNQTGLYTQAFEKHERDLKFNQQKMQKWKQALNEAANVAGWDSHAFRDESELIQKIVKDILQKLNHRYPPAELKGIVENDDNRAQIELLLREVQAIGIWGMGGIGKTTIAKALFLKYSSHYEGCCFLANVRENSEKSGNGLDELHQKLVSQLLEDEVPFIGTPSTFALTRLRRKKVFIVLDDVSTLEQLEYLVGESHCFGLGSKIMITTRDKHVLSKGVDVIYKVKELRFRQSLKLFRLNAFSIDQPIMEYEELSKKAVVYAKGIPLALKVLGSFLRGKSKIEWNSALKKLEKTPHENIQKVLRLSYDGLTHEEKKIFLDIACFFKGELKEPLISFLDSCGLYGDIGITTLHNKALIDVDDSMHVNMHDLIQQMGLQIVCEESIDEPERRSRIWDSKEIYDVLANNMGTRKVEGIKLDVSQIRDLHLKADIFKKMPNIRYLKFYSAFNHSSSHVHLPKGLKLLPNKLRYLEWYGFPLKSLPSTFCPEKLVKLCMPNSHIQKLWGGVQDFVSLKEINLNGSKQLKELPDFSKALNLEVVKLGDCESLHYVHTSILSLQSLVELDLFGCKKLRSLKSEFHLKSLQYIRVAYCSNLKEFSVSSEKMWELDLSQTGIEILHSSVGRSGNLKMLDLSRLRLQDLPNQLSCLRSLTMLRLSNCEVIDDLKLHILFDGMLSLREVNLNNCCNITQLPNNTRRLLGLECLMLLNCWRLRSLPELPSSIATLDASNCMSMEIVSTCRPLNWGEKYISFMNYMKLNEQSHHNIIEGACSAIYYELLKKYFKYCLVFVPGSIVPEWFRYRTAKSSIIVELPQISGLVGFSLCAVLDIYSKIDESYVSLKCACYMEGFKVEHLGYDFLVPKMKSDHVFMLNDAVGYGSIVKGIKERRGNQQFTNIRLSFKFSVERPIVRNEFNDIVKLIVVKGCGVCPIYHSDCQEFIRRMEMERNKKRPRDVDEQQLLPQSKKLKSDDMGTHANTCRDVDELEALLMRMDIN